MAHTAAPERAASQARLSVLVRENYDFIWRLVRRFGVASDAADDATQEVFMVATRRIDHIKVGSERSFLFGTALRVVSDRRRMMLRKREVSEDAAPELAGSADQSPEELTDQHRRRQLLDRVLDEMPGDLRTVFVLYEMEGMSTKEISELAEIPMGTTASRLRRAREEFRRRVRMLPGHRGEAS